MTELFKTKQDLNPPFMKDILGNAISAIRLRHGKDAQLPKVRTKPFGNETTANLRNKPR